MSFYNLNFTKEEEINSSRLTRRERELQNHLCNYCKVMASSSRATTPCRPSSYDVFINFRGPDTRKNFVSLLYKALIKERIHAFIDSKELWEGEEICPSLLRAIRGSRISIPVFSEHYADSKYCLLELAEIRKCHLSDGQTILPVFIDIEPRDVRHQNKSFKRSFQQHQRKCESADVQYWKNALREVGNLKGWTLNGDATIEDQSNVVESIVQMILRELSAIPLDECKHRVGIESHIDKLLPLLNIGSDDVRFVAICGMGGLGKTTIAHAIYNCIFRSFNGSSFLIDVRVEASHGDKGLVSLQKRLLKEVLKREYDISIVSQGSQLIKERLHREKILLILDDVDNHRQIDKLAGGINWFGKGSRVIITTRDEESLKTHKVDKNIQIYKPEVLDFGNSLKLFSLHAFSKVEPPEKYKLFSDEIVCYAKGLPLTLEVLGCFLFGKEEKEWQDTLKGLKDILENNVSGMPIRSYDDEVLGKLRISYENLSDHARTIFLDIACHFVGWEVEEAILIWEASELCARLAIKELTQKHLIMIDTYGSLKMHDQLCCLGKRIVSIDSSRDPTKRTRLWSSNEILKILKKDKETQMVEGILFDWNFKFENEDNLSCGDFAKMPNLRFLNVYPIDNLIGNFSDLPSKLRWFSWHHCSLTILPANFYHEELVHLDLSRSHITLAWNVKPQNKNKQFHKLKVLILSNCEDLSFSPDFSWFPCLQRLDLMSCSSLLELKDSICQIVSLKSLILSSCVSFKKLPMRMGNLTHLVKLYVNSTKIEELPESVGQLEKLEELDVSDCPKLVRLPTSMGRMRSLHQFYLFDTMIVKLPYDFSELPSLEVLNMGKSHQPLPISSNRFPSKLLELYLVGSINLESFPELPSTLTRLEVDSSDFYLSLTLTTRNVKLKEGFSLQQMLSQQPNIDDNGQKCLSDNTEEVVMEEEGTAAGSGVWKCFVMKAVWDCICNCFSTRFLVKRPCSHLVVLLLSSIALILFRLFRIFSSGDVLLVPT